jgi:hypothetical protein
MEILEKNHRFHSNMIVCRLGIFFQDNGVAGFDFLKASLSEVTVNVNCDSWTERVLAQYLCILFSLYFEYPHWP